MSTPLPTQPVDAPTELSALLGDQAPPPWYRRPALWISVVALLLAGGGLWWWLSSRAASAAPSYSTQAVTRGDLTLTVSANGTIQPTRSIRIGSELSGTVLKVNVDVNDRIKKGSVAWTTTSRACPATPRRSAVSGACWAKTVSSNCSSSPSRRPSRSRPSSRLNSSA